LPLIIIFLLSASGDGQTVSSFDSWVLSKQSVEQSKFIYNLMTYHKNYFKWIVSKRKKN
jgi:hypothetical protein